MIFSLVEGMDMQKDKKKNMMPIAPLMIEHRLIERMVVLMKAELVRIEEENVVNPGFIDTVADFLHSYVDECHHGKEESILFERLSKKELSLEHSRLLRELIDDHKSARDLVSKMVGARQRYSQGDQMAKGEIIAHLAELTELYPLHIEKEDKRFFLPCMDYFNRREQDAMLQDFWEYDRKMIHTKYEKIIEQLEVFQNQSPKKATPIVGSKNFSTK
jgi:hemerythrin-like domain-containing protein